MIAPRSAEKPYMKILPAAFAVAAVVCLGVAATAQSLPDIENGRYALSPVGDGVVRLDTRTGSVSTCNNSGSGWACYVVPDERAAMDAEIGRLQAENEKLKADLAAREPTVAGKIEEPLPKQDSLKPPPPKAEPFGCDVCFAMPPMRMLPARRGFIGSVTSYWRNSPVPQHAT